MWRLIDFIWHSWTNYRTQYVHVHCSVCVNWCRICCSGCCQSVCQCHQEVCSSVGRRWPGLLRGVRSVVELLSFLSLSITHSDSFLVLVDFKSNWRSKTASFPQVRNWLVSCCTGAQISPHRIYQQLPTCHGVTTSARPVPVSGQQMSTCTQSLWLSHIAWNILNVLVTICCRNGEVTSAVGNRHSSESAAGVGLESDGHQDWLACQKPHHTTGRLVMG